MRSVQACPHRRLLQSSTVRLCSMLLCSKLWCRQSIKASYAVCCSYTSLGMNVVVVFVVVAAECISRMSKSNLQYNAMIRITLTTHTFQKQTSRVGRLELSHKLTVGVWYDCDVLVVSFNSAQNSRLVDKIWNRPTWKMSVRVYRSKHARSGMPYRLFRTFKTLSELIAFQLINLSDIYLNVWHFQLEIYKSIRTACDNAMMLLSRGIHVACIR